MASPRRRSGRRGHSVGDAHIVLRTASVRGLWRCDGCVQFRYYGCAAHKDRGPAVCRATISPRRETGTLLVAELQKHVLAQDSIARSSSAYARCSASCTTGPATLPRLGPLALRPQDADAPSHVRARNVMGSAPRPRNHHAGAYLRRGSNALRTLQIYVNLGLTICVHRASAIDPSSMYAADLLNPKSCSSHSTIS